ncbi:MAG: NAD(P)-binding domain-containing protein [marine benthic group bacterium]|nr:NAD(P)-binding domain-containing protein [Candidatus Carthagonibacter metallireducens]
MILPIGSRRTTAVILGAGQAGLAMSRCLAERSIDHVVLERGEVANSWKTERWDSLRLLTPNWQSRLPGYEYEGDDPDGYRTMPETIRFIERYAGVISAPVRPHTTVTSVRPNEDGYEVVTDRGTWHCRTVVIATGACNIPNVPAVSVAVPPGIRQLTPVEYRNPDGLEEGGVLVVGASATGAQLADELHRSGRAVTLSAGEHIRVPRVYRGRDIQWWMDAVGVLDEDYRDVENLVRARSVPSLQLVGSDDRRDLGLNALSDLGVEVVGRLAGISGGRAQFSGSLANQAAMSDLKMNRLLDRIDDWVSSRGFDETIPDPHRMEPTRVPTSPALALDLKKGAIRTIVWATGFRPDYSWLDVPVLDRMGRIRHDGGVVEAPGLYLMGMPFLRRRKSSLIDGAGDDARELSCHLEAYLAGAGTLRSA